MFPKLRLVLACGALLSFASCVESEQPVSKIEQAEQDPRLYGLWTVPDRPHAYIVIGAEDSDPLQAGRSEVEPGLMRYWTFEIEEGSNKAKQPEGARFYCTKINGENFANWLAPVDKANPKQQIYLFVKYRVDDQHLTIWLQDPDLTAQAIEAGKVKGTVVREPKKPGELIGSLKSVRLTDTTENLNAFLASGGGTSCFPDKNKVTYNKVR